MVTPEFVKEFALSFDKTVEQPHFDKPSFRVNRKIFATLNIKMNRACVKLNLIDQNVFCSINPAIFYPVPNAWGKQGWTLIDLSKVRKSMFKDIITCAYNNLQTKKSKL